MLPHNRQISRLVGIILCLRVNYVYSSRTFRLISCHSGPDFHLLPSSRLCLTAFGYALLSPFPELLSSRDASLKRFDASAPLM
ncbi:hypothetical protein F4803DRAFT_526475 [Xylaria telfairii]|nr:hypothetical protein F4803DRAFT_526475 [Xylaria telfairii]